ncbi:MAG: 1,4-alpha-glucan branching protein domain-containing protein [Gemmatimonadales bacterium]|nr:1,4-alpha-glucan branching protein domain-containing protein [Gemmatimonadales bacterium]
MTTPSFVLMLHSHLPWVLGHGRWPHGSDWLTEAALDTYLPLVEALRGLEADAVPAPVTLGVTPVLANMLAHPDFRTELEAFLAQREQACVEAVPELEAKGEGHLVPLVRWWAARFAELRALWEALDGDLIAEFRRLQDAGRLELVSSAATHGFLPLLWRDESIHLQLGLGVAEHRRLFGRAPAGCWIPECAYRPRGPWAPWPGGPVARERAGIEEYLGVHGYRYFFVDSHLAEAGAPLGLYGEEREPLEPEGGTFRRSPYVAYRIGARRPDAVNAFVRDPRSSLQVWSRAHGYPGDPAYLEFHKIRYPGGLKLWRVTGGGAGLGGKQPYDPLAAERTADAHAAHFARLVGELGQRERAHAGAVIAVPFDTELFGHWWAEGPRFLAGVYRGLDPSRVRATTAGAHLAASPKGPAIRMPSGTWGANGDFSMWISPVTSWTWQQLWPLEQRYWAIARAALAHEAARPVLAQATRSLLLAQSSDWQFILSTNQVGDYGAKRFRGHCDDLATFLDCLTGAKPLDFGHFLAEEIAPRDACFPDVLPAVAAALELRGVTT